MEELQRYTGCNSDHTPAQIWCERSSHAPYRLRHYDYRGEHQAMKDSSHAGAWVGWHRERKRIHE
jgi:hypothetical protein